MKHLILLCPVFLFFVLPAVFGAPPEVVTGRGRLSMGSGYSAVEARDKIYSGDLTVSRGNASYRSYLHFDLTGLPVKPVKDAKLLLYSLHQYHTRPASIGFYELRQSFQGGSCSFNHASAGVPWRKDLADFTHPLAVLELGAEDLNCWKVVSGAKLTEAVSRWLQDAGQNHGMLLQDTQKYPGACFKFFGSSKSKQEYLPKLIISYDQTIDPGEFGVITSEKIIIRKLLVRYQELQKQLSEPEAKTASGIIAGLQKRKHLNWAEREDLEIRFRKLWYSAAQKLHPGKALAIWNASPWQHLGKESLPGAAARNWNGVLLQNEIQEMALGLTNLRKEKILCSIRVAGLPENAFRLRSTYWVEGIRNRQDFRPDREKFLWVDDALIPLYQNRTLLLNGKEHTRLWMTVDGRKLQPGSHRFTLTATDSDGGRQTIAGTVRVLAPALTWPDNLHISSYAYLDRPNTGQFQELGLQDILDHYENTFVSNCSKMPRWNSRTGSWDYTEIRAFLNFVRKSNPKKILFFWNGPYTELTPKKDWNSPAWQKRLAEAVRGWIKVCAEAGFPRKQFALYPVDEVYAYPCGRNVNAYQRLLDIVKVIKNTDPQAQIFANPICFQKDDIKYLQSLQPYIDIWAPIAELFRNADHHGHPKPFTLEEKKLNRKFFLAEQASGKPLWTYRCDGPVKILNVNSYYRQFSWEPWLNGVTGLGIWSYNDIRGSSWSDADRGDFNMIYELRDAPEEIQRCTDDRILHSVRYKAWRRSLQDYALMEMAAQKAGRPAVEQLVRQGLEAAADAESSESVRLKLIQIIGEKKHENLCPDRY